MVLPNGTVVPYGMESLFEFLYRLTKRSGSAVQAETLLQAAMAEPEPNLLLDVAKVMVQHQDSLKAREALKSWSIALARKLEGPSTKAASENPVNMDRLFEIVSNAVMFKDAEVIEELFRQSLPILVRLGAAESSPASQSMGPSSNAALLVLMQGIWTQQNNGSNQGSYPLVPRTDCYLLSSVYQALVKMNRKMALEEFVLQKVQQRQVGPQDIGWDIYLANILFWNKEFEEATATLQPVVEMFPEDDSLIFALIELTHQAGRTADAILIAQRMLVKDAQAGIARDIRILELSVSMGDFELGVATAKKLLSQPLSIQNQMQLVPYLNKLKMDDESAKIQSSFMQSRPRSAASGRASGTFQGTAPNQSQQNLLQLMQAQQAMQAMQIQAAQSASSPARGRNANPAELTAAEANATLSATACLYGPEEISDSLLLRVLVRTSVVGFRNQSAAVRSGNMTSNPQFANRLLAFTPLKKLKELPNRISDLEAKAKRPEALAADKALLIEAQMFADDFNAAIQGLRELLHVQPHSRGYRFLLAGLLCEEKQLEGYEIYLSLLKEHSDWMITTKSHLVPRMYWMKEQREPLAKTLLEIDPKILSKSTFALDFARDLLRDSEELDQGLELIEHFARAYRSEPVAFVSKFVERDSWLWKNDRFYQVIESLMLPDESAIPSNPWFGEEAFMLPHFAASSSTTNLAAAPSSGATPASVANLPASVVPTLPSGTAGNGKNITMFERFIDSLIRSSRLERWISSLDAHVAKHPNWFGGQALQIGTKSVANENFVEQESVSELLNNPAFLTTVPESVWFLIYSKLRRDSNDSIPLDLQLLAIGISRKFVTTSVSEISKRIEELTLRQVQHSQARDLLLKQLSNYPENNQLAFPVAEMLAKLGYQIDAIEILSSLDSSRTAAPQNAISGTIDDQLSVNARVAFALSDAIEKSRENFDPQKVAEQLFFGEASALRARQLQTFLSRNRKLFSSTIFSPAVDQFIAIGLRTDGAQLVQRLEELRKLHPTNLSLAVLESLWKIRSGRYTAAKILSSLQTVHQSIPKSVQPTDGSNDAAAQVGAAQVDAVEPVVYWLVAAAILKSEVLQENAELQQFASDMAEFSLAGLRQSGKVAEEISVLAEWGTLLVSRNQPQAAEQKWRQLLAIIVGAHESTGQQTPIPSSNQQEGRSLELARFQNLVDLSKKARAAGLAPLRSDALKLAFGPQAPQSPIEVAEVLRDLLSSPEEQPITREVYEILKSVVFPPNRSDSIDVHARVVSRYKTEVVDLASYLVDNAKNFDELELIAREIDRRGGDSICQLSMRILVLLSQDNTQQVQPLLDELTEALKTTGRSSRQTYPAVVAATRVESLKQDANKLLTKLGFKMLP